MQMKPFINGLDDMPMSTDADIKFKTTNHTVVANNSNNNSSSSYSKPPTPLSYNNQNKISR